MLNKLLQIARREYLETVKTKAFIIGIVILPVFMAVVMIFGGKLQKKAFTGPREDRQVAVRKQSRIAAVFGGVVVIAISDAMSDAMGIHLSEEADPDSTRAHIWSATLSTFITKFLVAISFALPLLVMPLGQAVIVGAVWGLIIISVMSFFLARLQQAPVWRAVGEHLVIALVVIAVSHFVGVWTRSVFV